MNVLSDNRSKAGTKTLHGARKFYELPIVDNSVPSDNEITKKCDDLVRYIDQNIIGKDKVFSGPYGLRTAVYCDYTASGRSLAFIEDYIREQILEDYGNTHTTTTVTSLQTTLFRHEARDIIRNAVNASEHDAVIFVGSGCTGAVHKLINALNLQQPPVVFVGPYEHHSNLLPWRELGGDVVQVDQTPAGEVDIDHLNYLLQCYQPSTRQLIGCFSAASNVTGTLVDVDQVTEALHRHGALAFWDYATAAPYVNIDMNPVTPTGAAYLEKDAIFISTHKFVGGVQTPGILVAKKKLFRNPVPTEGGGGSVFFVREGGHRYLQEVEMREEGGTPAIVESIRAGLVFQLKQAVSAHLIQQRDDEIIKRVHDAWLGVPNLHLLGNPKLSKLPVFSFVVRHPESGRLLHHNFVCAVLNDVFGIQARGGCACAGPYAQELLGIDEELAKKYEDVLAEDSRLDRTHLRRYREYSEHELLRPGFSRLNLPYFMDDAHIDFVIKAVTMTAQHAWKLLPQYNFNPETGEWRQRHHQVFRDRKWLGHVTYKSGEMMYRQPRGVDNKGELPSSPQHCLTMAQQLFDKAAQIPTQLSDQTAVFSSPDVQKLRWFLLPSEAHSYLTQATPPSATSNPFTPRTFAFNRPKKDWTNEPKTYVYQENLPVEKVRQLVKYVEANFDYNSEDLIGLEPETVAEKRASTENLRAKIEPFRKTVLKKAKPPQHDPSQPKKKKKKPVKHVPTVNEIRNTVEQEVDIWRMMANMPVAAAPEPKPNKIVISSEKESDFSKGMEEGLSQGFNGPEGEKLEKEAEEDEEPELVPVQTQPSIVKSLPVESSQEKQVNGQEEPALKKFKCMDGACLTKRETSAADVKADGGTMTTTTKYKWFAPPKSIFKPMCEAIVEYNMLEAGDKVLVCLSGGKDSLSLLHALHQYQYYAASKGKPFTLGAVTVDPMTSSYDPSPLKAYLAALELPYFYEEQNILESAEKLSYEVASICSYCSRMKRGRLYHAARREGYNVLAMGQHLDDLSESFLMSVFHNGLLRTMKASYSVQEGDLRVVRPLVYVREKDLRQFAEQKKLPVIAENCPACFEAPKERHRMKQLLAAQEVLHPRLFPSLQAALRPLMGLSRAKDSTRRLIEALLRQQHGQEDDDDDDEAVMDTKDGAAVDANHTANPASGDGRSTNQVTGEISGDVMTEALKFAGDDEDVMADDEDIVGVVKLAEEKGTVRMSEEVAMKLAEREEEEAKNEDVQEPENAKEEIEAGEAEEMDVKEAEDRKEVEETVKKEEEPEEAMEEGPLNRSVEEGEIE